MGTFFVSGGLDYSLPRTSDSQAAIEALIPEIIW
jgi:hypothetical protein